MLTLTQPKRKFMSDIRATIAVAQMDCALADLDANLNKIDAFAGLAKTLGADVVIFPECATTGTFIGERIDDLADEPDGPATRRLGGIAKARSITLVCGLYTRENGLLHNSQKVFGPDGALLATYHKLHLFSSERVVCTPGSQPVVVQTPIGKLGLTICYDLVFPGLVGQLIEMGADFIVNSTNWINDREQRDVWGWNAERVEGLASTRALENVVPLAMACRTGREYAAPDMPFDSIGLSCVLSPSGKSLARMNCGEGLAVGRIDIPAKELDGWTRIATYRDDRRPALYRR